MAENNCYPAKLQKMVAQQNFAQQNSIKQCCQSKIFLQQNCQTILSNMCCSTMLPKKIVTRMLPKKIVVKTKLY